MTRKIIVCLIATILLVAGCSSSDDFSSTSYGYVNPGQMPTVNVSDFSSTWYGYLNPGQMPTVTDIKNFYTSFGSYPTLTDVQYRHVINDPSMWAGFDFPAETK
ncbi:MAG: hypothetical protein WD688_10235 [Candidatus Binatia bacterium]